ncbi:MAG TPA: ABC transporter permease [Acidimicrobiales bacterium]
MSAITEAVEWFTASEQWSGPSGIPARLVEHAQMSATAIAIALAIALPVGLVLGHVGRGGVLAINVSNVGRAIPSFALLVLAVQVTGIGTAPTVIALVALAVPPIVTNAYVGMRGVDRDVREAAHGMGMTAWQQLWRVEARLALPLVMAGVRTSAVQCVATATLGAVVASGGLGRFIVDGFASQDYGQVVGGAVLVALSCIALEVGLGVVEARVTPRRVSLASPAAHRALPGLAGTVAPAGPS